MPTLSISSTVWKSLIGLGTATTVVIGLIQVWSLIENQIESAIKISTDTITKEINIQTANSARIYKNDLYDRIVFFEAWAESEKENGKKIPERLKFHIKAMNGQYTNL